MSSFNKTFRFSDKGFTLVELLVVISIIAMLLAILMPTLSKAREQGRKVVCQSNLKQINLAARLWSADNDDWMLPATWDRNPTPGVSKSGYRLNPYLGAEKRGSKIYQCPNMAKSGETIPNTHPFYTLFTGGTPVWNSYAINHYLCMTTTNGPGSVGSGPAPWGPDSVYFYTHGNTKLLSIRKPKTTIYFIDCALFYATENLYSDTYFPSVSQVEKGRRHLSKASRKDAGRANIAWCDGSVSIEPDNFEIITSGRKGPIIEVSENYFRGK